MVSSIIWEKKTKKEQRYVENEQKEGVKRGKQSIFIVSNVPALKPLLRHYHLLVCQSGRTNPRNLSYK